MASLNNFRKKLEMLGLIKKTKEEVYFSKINNITKRSFHKQIKRNILMK